MVSLHEADVVELLAFIDACPTPFHVVDRAAAMVRSAGFVPMDLGESWPDASGSCFVAHGGSLVAWRHRPEAPSFRIIGAHTDSPNLRITPRPDTGGFGYRQLGVEVYGSPLLNSWLDRDLGVAGRVATRWGTRLFSIDRPVLRVPQLAIHLDREVNQKGLLLNPQHHMAPVWGLGLPTPGEFAAVTAEAAGLDAGEVLAWDAMLHDLTPGTTAGPSGEFIFASRIDNQVSCWAGLQALLNDPIATEASPSAVLCLFDHEEVGSMSARGALSPLLPTVLERIAGGRDALLPMLARSLCVSADGAHATHPNYPERHEPGHHVFMGAGPVIKRNANQRYATDAVGEAAFVVACEQAGLDHQVYVHRGDMPCGSTIGPLTAATTGVTTVDVGVAQLSMHSAREMCATSDALDFARALGAFLRCS
ncbi:M18 family aminopeptidase [Candidatus Poriferisocius sp.]|uniref:M18 family aminopeptidase n=1 Tax=Candidatus Poriferisocius sp. TaxID=3101276 RepID=UPI003B01B55F